MKTNLKRISKRSLALILGILMLFSTLMVGIVTTEAASDTFTAGSVIYFTPGDNWSLADATFKATVHYSDGTNDIQNVLYTEDLKAVSGETGMYYFTLPSNTDYSSSMRCIVFHRMSPSGNEWANIKILANSRDTDDQNHLTHTGWENSDNSTNTWSIYNPGGSTGGDTSDWKVHANFDTTDSNWEDYPLNTVNGNVVSGTIEITETGDRLFGIDGTSYYKEDSTVNTITRDSNSATLVTNGSNDAKITFDATGTYTFAFNTNTGELTVTYPSTTPTVTTAPTETTSPTDPTTPVTTTYYISGIEIGDGWGDFRSLEVGGDGTYSYYQNTSDSLTFKIAAQGSWNDGVGVYGFPAVTNGFNASDVTLSSSDSVSGQDANIVCTTNPAYIIVYHPNTALNKGDTPIICAATSLPSGGQQYSITAPNDDPYGRVVVQSSAAANENVSFSLRFDTGYELNQLTVTGAEEITPNLDDTGTYTFKMPAHPVTISVTSKPSEVTVTNKYYIRGLVSGVGNWTTSAKMTISTDGFYEYYEVTDGTAAEFLIDKDDTKGTNGSYNKNNMNAKFNGTNLELGTNGNNVTVAAQSGTYYIIVYYPNTTVNTSTAPIICAATKLPSGLQQTVNVVAKDGTNDAKFAAMANTTITASADVTGVTDDAQKEYATATAKAGKEITITTTIDDTNKADYFVKGWVVNGESVGIRSTDTATNDGVYTTTFTIDPLWIGDNGNLEITPVFFHTVNESNKNEFITFYVEDFNKGANETWGNTVACYPYYYTGSGTTAVEDFGAYPGQPMLKGAGDRYYVQVPKKSGGYDISGITLNNYHNDGQHAALSGTTANLQTYDYDDFVMILEAHPDATNIAFKFKFNGDYDNAPSTTSYGDDDLITAAGKGGWEYLKNYNGDSLTNIYGANISNDTTNYLRVISNGYDSATGYIGQYATCWYVYAPNANGAWDYVTKIAPSALVFEDATALGNSDASSFVDAYNTLQQYSDYAVQIAYEGNATGGGSSSKRCDGKWYYTIKGQEIVGNILIQYENEAIADRGTYTYDKFTGTGVGEKTGANPHFTNAEATDPHTFVTTLDNDKQFTFSADTTTGRYQFIGWYILESEGAEPTFYTKDVDASAVRNKSFTFVARYKYVDEIAEIHITYNFKDFQPANSDEIAYTTDHDKSKDSPNTYTTSDTLIVAYTNNDEEIAKIVKKNAPMIHSDYYDYSLNNASISYSYNTSTKTVYATATMDDTPHVYSVTVNGNKFEGYYQNTLELYADDFGLTYTDDATALWYLVDGSNKTLYYDKFDLNYRFIVDKAVLEVVANTGNEKLDGESVIYNSYYNLGYRKDTNTGKSIQTITQNFFITDYLDNAYDDDGNVITNATNIKYVGGGILYYSSDENGVAQNTTAAAALADKEGIINTALGSNYTSDKSGAASKVGYIYNAYSKDVFRYSEFLVAYQHIIGLTMDNVDTNADKHISAYSFFVYTYQVGETTYTQIQISDTMAVATAYEPY